MCGINGILHLSSKLVDKNQLVKMRDVLAHRGPDDAGIFIEKNIGLGHRRLAIIDTSSAGHQPFYSENGRYVIVFNGEIYNYKDFYAELKDKGVALKSDSDTEVLLKLYELYGLEILPRLNGMFAFAIWDKEQKKLVLARDRMGVKPLYYSLYQSTLYFASEQKALFAAGIPIQISESGLEEYFFNRFVAGENTLYNHVNKILPGHYMTIYENGNSKTTKWWNLKEEIQNHETIANPKKWFEETFFESVRLRMVSDVPVGVLLSGGLDSGSILSSLYHQDYKNIQTFNIGFSEEKHNESYLAKNITEEYNYEYNSMKVEGDLLYDSLLESSYFQDEPLMHLNEPHLLAVSKLANAKVKVLLSGEGADELMGGYVRYKALRRPTLLKAISYLSNFNFLNNNPRFNKLLRYSKITNNSDLVLFNSTSIYPNDIHEFYGEKKEPINEYRYQLLNEAKELYPNSLQRQALYFDQHTYMCSLLDRNDRCTMGASIECREPFLDQRLVAGLGTLDDNWLFSGKKGKYILKNTMQDKLPQDILNFKKIGLSVPWENQLLSNDKFKEELRNFAKSEIFSMPFLENLNGKKIVEQIEKGDKKIIPYIMPLFMLHIWQKKYFQKFI
ncbi:asparagine synthase (glutamine-hydrolyzing) [Flavobacterium psychrophilum]|uniref:asparagine synthase (glutamine-hydrolyzing) n=1 Tax=Flavobacterium psychrophilum TaxID=96345 RepID=A0A7U2UCS5_FLAPS|nr:asparagine synthase (glutamine-hydrolyzing) [Flavobacterium psychrophilum]EKT3956504.1 asparagine synthase (glutamine-hydrolyzing) [Flavobacterium psychrophilum]EKT4498217.1 asparagine synthase (glutamine-hydrolyzing) [Flavobacterium psychrophilum]EKT4509892.1 asparagine synthase (glutamine-hydrolyzing) [Flavobacterium psychrophilum]EKT4519310.1 asparagine synthase (glutamine-hydrolyzing) [Flavobacterium psychrophilum]ELM3643419.1 asparagine synthase (glutamine-hydrolyzing) [Flavobacterium 